jgi:hypothetical protein
MNLSRKEISAILAKSTIAPRNKYRATATKVDGIRFPSKKEANRYCNLKLLVKAGKVVRFHRQVIFDLPGGVKYLCDFMVIWANGEITYEDAKGFRTPVYRMKFKQVADLFGVTIREV